MGGKMAVPSGEEGIAGGRGWEGWKIEEEKSGDRTGCNRDGGGETANMNNTLPSIEHLLGAKRLNHLIDIIVTA